MAWEEKGYVYATEKLESSITCIVKGFNDGTTWGNAYKKVNWSYKPYGAIEWITGGNSSISSNTNEGGLITLNNLQSGTKYELLAEMWASAGGGYVQYGYATGVATTAIGNFNWSYAGYQNGSLVSGSRKTKGYGFYVSAIEWNSLIANVRAKLQVRGMYNESKYQLNLATATSGDIFTATKFNLVRAAIGALSSTGLSNKSSGDIILAADLNLLMDKINLVVL